MKNYTDIISKKNILIIDDHANIRFSLKTILEGEKANITEAEDIKSAYIKLGEMKSNTAFPYDLVLLDIRLPDGSGLDILEKIAQIKHSSKVIVISGEGALEEAFKATHLGAFDYIEKPFTPERLLVSVARALDYNNISSSNQNLKKKLTEKFEILGHSDSITKLIDDIKKVAPTNGRVLIEGESGTGKELVAHNIFSNSARKDKPYIKINCAAIPSSLIESELFGHEKGSFTGADKMRKGLFERANEGTLFLDEIGELDLEVQVKLLRVLQNNEITRIGGEKSIPVDVRLLAATHRNLPEMIKDKLFREDLYYRLNVVQLSVPPLRERKEDIKLLSDIFLEQICEENSIGERSLSKEAHEELKQYEWPGNIRQLRNLLERVAILSEHAVIESVKTYLPKQSTQTPQHLKLEDDSHFHFSCEPISWHEFHEKSEHSYVNYILGKAGGNVSEAARNLGLERAYLHRLIKKLGVERP